MVFALARTALALLLIPAAVWAGLFALGSVAAMLVFASVAAAAAILVAPPGFARNAFLAAATVVICGAMGEAVLRFSGEAENLSELWQVGRRVQFSGQMFQTDDTYGYSMVPNSTSSITVTREGKVVYDVVYSIDAYGGRATPPANNGRIAIILAGDSFNFGDGLRDDETLSFFLQKKSANRLRVPNIAVTGYGMHQVLRQLELDVPSRYGVTKFDWLVLSVVDNHLERVNGRYDWSRGSPRYVLDGEHRVKYAGKLAGANPPDWLKRLRSGSRLYLAIEQGWVQLVPTQDGKVFAAILTTIQDLARRKYSAKTLVLYHAGHTYFKDYTGRRAVFHRLFQEAGVAYIDVYQAVPNIDASHFIPGDGHASAKLNAILAEMVLKATGEPDE